MVVHKQRANMCNKTLMSSDDWGPFLIKLYGIMNTVWGLLSWMQVVTFGKVTLGQVMVKGGR